MPTRKATLFSATLGEDRKIEPPLGPLYIASALESVGWSVDFRDFQLFNGANCFDPEGIRTCLEAHEDVVLISCFVDTLPIVLAACELIKADSPGSVIILGGPGPTAGARPLLERYPHIDGIVLGEGDETIKDWARLYGSKGAIEAPIKGMVLRQGDNILEGAQRPRIEDAEALGRPAYHLIDWSRYTSARIVTTRGCPYRCSFCDVAPLWGRRAIYRDLQSTVDEILFLRDHCNQQAVAIVDDTFVLNRDRVRDFCRLMIAQKVEIEWGCFGRINLMSEELVALMAEAGCRAIFYGIDSGSQNVLNRTFKELDAETIVPTLEISAKYFSRIEASFIWGYPFETYEDFLHTINIASQASKLAPIVNVQLHMLSPLPSSPLCIEFHDQLCPPDKEDQSWLLLPAVLLDDRAERIRRIVRRAPDLFPGFFTFPTLSKAGKRDLLNEALRSIDHILGRTVFEPRIFALLNNDDRDLERELLREAQTDVERIGVGLALGLLQRTRRRQRRAAPSVMEHARGAGMTRERNDGRAA